MIPATINFTESVGFPALGNFIMEILGLASGQVIQGQGNRTAEPPLPDYVVMTSIRQERLATNMTEYFDNVLTGSITAAVLTVTAVAQTAGPGIQKGMLLIDSAYPTMNIAAGTIVGTQLTGTPGGIGTYAVSPSQTLAAETLYAGLETDLVDTKWTVQLDIHGPNSGSNTKIIEGLFRSEFGVNSIGEPSSWLIVPLYCDEARQMPFINAESQYEERYVMDACMQINPVIGIPAQFFDQVEAQTIEGSPLYVEGGQAVYPNPNPPSNDVVVIR